MSFVCFFFITKCCLMVLICFSLLHVVDTRSFMRLRWCIEQPYATHCILLQNLSDFVSLTSLAIAISAQQDARIKIIVFSETMEKRRCKWIEFGVGRFCSAADACNFGSARRWQQWSQHCTMMHSRGKTLCKIHNKVYMAKDWKQ